MGTVISRILKTYNEWKQWKAVRDSHARTVRRTQKIYIEIDRLRKKAT